ncbi:MAG TPA: hypothetical protein VFQ91_19830, partial [Bryobacteraceae bacterium]|nr:hypothetical protein [Bryobacteraceae bacterium]
MRLVCLLFATIGLSAVAQELAFPLTARLQSRIPAAGLPADSYYLPGSSDVTCFEGSASGSRILCLSDSGTILEWTADDRIRTVADGFVGPLQAKVAPNGSIYVLDKGRGTLSKIAPNGTVSVVMKSGSDRVIRERMDPASFDLPLFVVSRDNYLNSAQLAMDPQGNPYLGFLREETNNDTGTKRFLYIFRLEANDTALILHWDGSATLANATSLPTFDALSVDKDRNIFFSTGGRLNRLTPSLQDTALVDGRYTVLNSNPVQGIVQTDDGNIFLHSRTSKALFRLAFADLRVDLDQFSTLTGFIARRGNQLIGLDLQQKRSLQYAPDPARLFVPQLVSRLLRYIPATGSNSFRAAFDNPVSVSVDLLSQVFVADAEDMSVYRIAANGTVTRVAQSNYNPDVPVTRPTTENQAMDSMPYPVISIAHDVDGRLLMIDSNCTFFVQTGANTARRAGGFSNCANAAMLYDQAKRLHVALPVRGLVLTGTGDTLTGDWQFSTTFTSSSNVRSISMLPSGDVLVLEGTALGTWSLKRVNPNTKDVTPIRLDDAIANGNNLNLTSIATDAGGRILAVACCTIGSSNESSRRYLYNFQLSGTNVLSGSPRPVTYYDGAGQVPDRLFSHPRGILIRTNQNRIYYFEDQQFRSQASVSLPNRQTWTYKPDSGVQELAVPVFPGYGPTAFRTKLTCDNGFEKFLRLGPSAAVAPTQLRLGLDTQAAPSRAASCKIELSAVDTTRVLATTTVDLAPDAALLAQIPSISLLEQLTPFKVDPTQSTVTKTVRLINNSPDNVAIQLEGTLPDGITATPATLTLEPKQSGDVTFTIVPPQLFRQSYQIPLRANCATCKAAVPMELSFQITGRTTSIDISAESALVDIAALNTRNSSRQS